MRESDTFATRFLYGVILFCVVVTGVLAVLGTIPRKTEAAGTMADAMCICQMDPKVKVPPFCPTMPCFDVTSGFTTPGMCVSPGKCSASSPAGQPPMLPMIPPPMPPPPSQDQPCGAGGQGGVGGDASGIERTGSSTDKTASSTPGCSSGGGFDFPATSFPSFDSTNMFGNTGSGSAGGIDTGSNVSSLLNGNLGGNSDSSGSGGSIVPGSTTAPVPPFGSAEGISGDIRLQGTAVTLLVSNRDSARGTQVSGQYGFTVIPGITALTIFKTMCALRPWANGYISFIIPSTYFDSLCTARGFALNARITGSTAGLPTRTASPAPAARPPGPPPPPPYLGPTRADIWATPPSVSSGGRTSIFWSSTGVSTCAITSSDNAFTGSSLSGHASSQQLTRNTTFSINCMSATSTVSNQVVVTVQ